MIRSLLAVVCICTAFVAPVLSAGATEDVDVSIYFQNAPLRDVLGHFRSTHGYDVKLATEEWAEETVNALIQNASIEEALRVAEERGIRGKVLTPFLLERISEVTGGESQRANVALLENNARVATEIAKALHGTS